MLQCKMTGLTLGVRWAIFASIDDDQEAGVTMIWNMWKKGFYAWEGATAQYMEQVLTSPATLYPAGAMLTALMKMKAKREKTMANWWGNVAGLPTRRDQERTLHALNQIQSRLIDLEEKLADIDQAR
jgi:hypothetical protein